MYIPYDDTVPIFDWNPEKNVWLEEVRGICFEDVMNAVDDGTPVRIVPHPHAEKYPHQQMLIIKIREYTYCVPFVIKDRDTLFLKTIYPSRSAHKRYQSEKPIV